MNRCTLIVLITALLGPFLLAPAGRAGEARPLVVLIGDSTTAGYGGPQGYTLSRSPLESLVSLLPVDSPWRHTKVLNLAIPDTTTRDWAERASVCPPPGSSPPGSPLPAGRNVLWIRLLGRACASHSGLVREVVPLLPHPIAAALVVLGTNDPVRLPDATPEQAVANLRAIAAALRPARVFIASPFAATDPQREPFVRALRTRLLHDGLLTGPDFASIPLPLDASGVHLTRGGFAAAAGLWLDTLATLP
jgi:hypothetical protein